MPKVKTDFVNGVTVSMDAVPIRSCRVAPVNLVFRDPEDALGCRHRTPPAPLSVIARPPTRRPAPERSHSGAVQGLFP